PYAARLDMAAAIERVGALRWSETGSGPNGETGTVVAAPAAWGDVVLARKEMPTSYHLSVVLDDALQGVTHVVRGMDLFWSTRVPGVWRGLLAVRAPTYHHHRLLLEGEGNKLSNPPRATALRPWGGAGVPPADVRRMVGLPRG